MVKTCVICMLFDSNKIWHIHLFANIMFNCHQGIYYSYILFCRHVGADFNGRFLDGYRCVKKDKYHCQKFEAELKIICVEFRNSNPW